MKIFNKDNVITDRMKKAENVPILKIGNLRQTLLMEGRVIASIVLDTTNRPDIESMILSHQDINSGHVLTTWALNKKNKNEVILVIEFTEPFNCCFSLIMNIEKYGMAIENIMRYNVVYLQSRNLGNSDNILLLPSILIEVPSEEAKRYWDTHLILQTEKFFRKRGYSKKSAKQKTLGYLKEQFEKYFYLENL